MVSLVMIGDAMVGKSTIMGNIIHMCYGISDKVLDKHR